MAKENVYKAIILRQQAFGEGDEILTVFSEEHGKLRFLAKAVKLPKSKLQYSLQTLFLVKLTVASRGSLPRVIGAEVLETFADIRQNLKAAKLAFYVLELTLKFTPDEQRNENLFHLLHQFLNFLNQEPNLPLWEPGLAKFKIEFLQSVGLGLHYGSKLSNTTTLAFSNSQGQFASKLVGDAVAITPEAFRIFLDLKKVGWQNLPQLTTQNLAQLQNLLTEFINYHLEREIKSERFL